MGFYQSYIEKQYLKYLEFSSEIYILSTTTFKYVQYFIAY